MRQLISICEAEDHVLAALLYRLACNNMQT